MSKLTKIVATIGPATETSETLEALVKAGMNVARFNTKHGTAEWHAERIARIQEVSRKLGQPVAVLLDLQGPEIRANLKNEGSFEMEQGETAIFSSDENRSEEKMVLVPQEVVEAVEIDSLVSMEDGLCEFIVTKKHDTYFEVEAQGAFTVAHRKTVNTPGTIIDMPSLIEADLEKLDAIKDLDIEYVALSFVRTKEDVLALRKELDERNMKADIVSKVENQASLDHFDEILEVSDAIMVARGDLAVEVPFRELIHWQRTIINKCRQVGKPVITATQMLKSMVKSPLPTRAEVSDVAHAIYDGTDAVMLSEESTIGDYPVKAVETQATIAEYNEPFAEPRLDLPKMSTTESLMTDAARSILQHSSEKFDKVIVLTETGHTAQLFSRFHLNMPIVAVTRTDRSANKLALSFGVTPVVMEFDPKKMDSVEYLNDEFIKTKIISTGERALVIHGRFWGQPGKIGSVSVIEAA